MSETAFCSSERASDAIGRIKWDQLALKVNDATKPNVRYSGSGLLCHPSVLVYIITEYARQIPADMGIKKAKDPSSRTGRGQDFWAGAKIDAKVDSVADELVQADLCDAIGRLLGRAKPITDAVVAYGRYADDAHAEKLIAMIADWEKWKNPMSKRNAYIARGALILSESKTAMRYFESIKHLDTYASKHGQSPDKLRSQMDDVGLDANEEKAYDLGGRTVIAYFGPDLSWRLRDQAGGKEMKSIPKRGSDLEKYESAKADFAMLKRESKKLVKARSVILFDDFLSGKGFASDGWQSSYLTNPVMRALAETIVWMQDGKTFTVHGGKPERYSGETVELGKSPIKVAHPVEMSAIEINAWRNYFAKNELKQPFEQIWERVVVKTKKSIERNRYKGFLIPAYRFKGREKHGLHIDMGEYNDHGISIWFDDVDVEIKQHDFDWKSLDNRMEIIEFKPTSRITMRKLNHIVVYLDCVCFYPRVMAGDMTVMDELDGVTLAQIIDYVNIASENGATELAAALLEYRDNHFGEYSNIESLLLD